MCVDKKPRNKTVVYIIGMVRLWVTFFYMFVAFKCLQRIQTLKNSE